MDHPTLTDDQVHLVRKVAAIAVALINLNDAPWVRPLRCTDFILDNNMGCTPPPATVLQSMGLPILAGLVNWHPGAVPIIDITGLSSLDIQLESQRLRLWHFASRLKELS